MELTLARLKQVLVLRLLSTQLIVAGLVVRDALVELGQRVALGLEEVVLRNRPRRDQVAIESLLSLIRPLLVLAASHQLHSTGQRWVLRRIAVVVGDALGDPGVALLVSAWEQALELVGVLADFERDWTTLLIDDAIAVGQVEELALENPGRMR